MNPRLLALVSIRALAQLSTLQGQTRMAANLTWLANAIESGRDIDTHMQSVADALNDDSPVSWDDVQARIDAEAEELRNR